MALKECSPQQAFSEGSTLWVIGDKHSSFWSQKIDWYLQFQIARALKHQRSPLNETLKANLALAEVELPEITSSFESLLVFSLNHLPNRQTVQVTFTGDVKKWVAQIHSVWKKLAKPSTRVFLPRNVEHALFSQHWPEKSVNLELVPDVPSQET